MNDMGGRPPGLAPEPIELAPPNKALAPRLVAGLIFAQGLYLGLQQLWSAAVLAGVVPEETRLAVQPYLAPALQVLGVLIGGLVAGAGNSRGVIAGAVIGLANAVAFVLPSFASGKRPPDFLLFGAWLPLAVFGGAGGLLARQVFPSLFDLPDPNAKQEKEEKAKKKKEPPPPLAWFRVLGGAALSVGCTVWAGMIRDFIVGSAGGRLVIESRLQAEFIAWIISALAMIAGGAFAGAGTITGLRHGFLVGLLASASTFVIHHQIVQEAMPAEQFFATLFGLPDSGLPEAAQTLLFLLTNSLLLGTLGGWLGGALLPKVSRKSTGPLDRAAI
jgi:hypothetical protein